MYTPNMPGSVAKVLLMPQITSECRGARSKQLVANPAFETDSAPAAQQVSATAPATEVAAGSWSAKAATPPSPIVTIILRTNVADRPACSNRSAITPARLQTRNPVSQGAADRI